MNKYNAKKTVVDGHKFDSKKEANRYKELDVKQQLGIIKNLELQPVFILQDKFKFQGKTIQAIKYIADFRYEKDGKVITEDVKGKKTQVYSIKRKMLFKTHPGINFVET